MVGMGQRKLWPGKDGAMGFVHGLAEPSKDQAMCFSLVPQLSTGRRGGASSLQPLSHTPLSMACTIPHRSCRQGCCHFLWPFRLLLRPLRKCRTHGCRNGSAELPSSGALRGIAQHRKKRWQSRRPKLARHGRAI